MAVLYTQA